jgi:hypothetical protein
MYFSTSWFAIRLYEALMICFQGNILYRFPLLQRTASSRGAGVREYVGTKWSEMFSGIEKYLEEKPWEFR